MTVDINTGCCQANNCTPAAPIVSSGNTTANGLVCPSCFTLTSSTCVPDTTINCTGSENRCTTYSISTTASPPAPIMAMAGCATDNMCSNYTGTATSISGTMAISIGCSNATVSPSATSSSTASPSSSRAPVSISDSVPTTNGIQSTSDAKTQSYQYTTAIANSYPSSNSSAVYYSTRVTFTPTAYHSSTRGGVTSTCVCSGCARHHAGLALIVTFIYFLVRCFL
ncbi:hypothetical protein GDO81_029124 [Engystomops pustulosus]|uniref:Uncharacterized protein n=1 Tax=Engystomops pustulosus TaxID=76066 RepID=A0AAV6ZDP8_ENGPU|nr:hypothetical protein GDO81_029124 [Engystomops pustulosus]